MIVTITDEEFAELRSLAKLRNNPKMMLGWGSGTYRKDSNPLNIHLIGLMGEYAVSKVLNTDIDRGFHPDDGYDLTYKGRTVSVKTRTRKNWDFISDEKDLADILALVWVENILDHLWRVSLEESGHPFSDENKIPESPRPNPNVVGFATRDMFKKYAAPMSSLNDKLALGWEYFGPIEDVYDTA